MTEVCDCGFEAKNATGLAAHERHCDESEGGSPDSSDTPPTVSTAVAEQALERDNHECRKCGADESLDVHRYRDNDKLANHVTLCESCLDEIGGYHHLTQKNMVKGIYE